MRLARPGAAQIPSGWRPKRSAKARLASSAPSVRSRRSVDIAPYLLDRAGLVSSTNRTMVDQPSKHSTPPGARPTENTCTTSLYRRFPSRAVLVVHRAVGVGGLMEVMQLRRPLCRDHHFHFFLVPSTRSPARPGMGHPRWHQGPLRFLGIVMPSMDFDKKLRPRKKRHAGPERPWTCV